MYLLNQEKPWYLSDEWYVTVEEFDAIRRMNFPKDFIDFFEIAFRTGLHEKDILNLKKENITFVHFHYLLHFCSKEQDVKNINHAIYHIYIRNQ